MTTKQPTTELDTSFSSEDATARPWTEVVEQLEQAGTFWVTTVRPDGRPHVTPLIAAWVDDALWFCTGPTERKAKNLAENPHCVLTTGANSFTEGLDVVVEGEARRVRDESRLQRVADRYVEKYEWKFDVRDGSFYDGEGGGEAYAFEVAPVKAFAFGKGEPYSQTRYRFS